MPVKSFECAIARSQISRYLAGDALVDEAMRQLETHISGCADCQRLIESKRTQLLGPLAQAPTAEEATTLTPQSEGTTMERELRAAAMVAQAAVRVNVAKVAQPALVGVASGGATNNAEESAHDPAEFAWSASDPNARMPRASIGPRTAAAEAVSAGGGSSAPVSSASPVSPKATSSFGAAFSRFSLPKLVRDVPDEEPSPLTPASPSATPGPKANRSLGKVAAYGGSLLIVLGVMAYLGDPTSLLGGKASSAPAAKAKAKPAPKTAVAQATGVRRTALGVPITDAVDPKRKARSKTARPLAAQKAAKTGDPADLGPIALDASLHAPVAPKTRAKVPVKTAAPEPKSTSKPKPTAEPTTEVSAIPHAASKPTNVAPKRSTSRPTPRRTKRARKAAARPAPTSKPVIRVYDETGKPIN